MERFGRGRNDSEIRGVGQISRMHVEQMVGFVRQFSDGFLVSNGFMSNGIDPGNRIDMKRFEKDSKPGSDFEI